MKVLTTKGLLNYEDLSVKDVVELGDNYRKVATEWYDGDELVRRSVAVEMLRPVEAQYTEGVING